MEMFYGNNLTNFFKNNLTFTVLVGIVEKENSLVLLKNTANISLFNSSIIKQESWKSRFIMVRENSYKKNKFAGKMRPDKFGKIDRSKKFYSKDKNFAKFDLNK